MMSILKGHISPFLRRGECHGYAVAPHGIMVTEDVKSMLGENEI